MVIISLGKLLLVMTCLGMLAFSRPARPTGQRLSGLRTPIAVLCVLFAFAFSLLWTAAPQADALGSLAKYGKLILIVLMMIAIRDRREASFAVAAFFLAQAFLLASSWMLFAHLPVPWATSHMAVHEYSVFSSYLDQGIMSAVFAALCWHLREHAPGRSGKLLATFMALAAMGNVLFVLSGRSGHIVAIVLLSMAIMWQLPQKYRAVVVLLPFLLALGLYFSSTKVRDRLSMVNSEVQSYSIMQAEPATSSGIRLNLWRRAIQIINQHPLTGSGIGSWSHEFNQLQREQNPAHIDIDGNGNPHQEYLLWGVQLGIPGIVLFFTLLASILRDTMKMETSYARATQSTLMALAVACLFNSSIYDAQIGDFFCILLGLLMALGLGETASQTGRPASHKQAM